ncbi:potassium transporter TrkA, partial [Halobacteriales archaeon QS_5_70_17]
MMTLYAHSKGDAMAAEFPKRVSLRSLRERTLSSEVVELVGGTSEATVEVHGDVADVEGYPPLPGDLRARIRDAEWTFPGDLPLSELERRVADRPRTQFDLAHVTVRVDGRGRATVAAAPPVSGLSRRVPVGTRAVSV